MDPRINQMMAKPEYRSGNHPLAALVQSFKPATRKIQDEIAQDAERANVTRQNGEQQVRTNQASSEKRRIDRDVAEQRYEAKQEELQAERVMMDSSTRDRMRAQTMATVERFTAENTQARAKYRNERIEDKTQEVRVQDRLAEQEGLAERASTADLRSRLALRQLMQQREQGKRAANSEQQPDARDAVQAAAVSAAQQQRQYADAARHFGIEGRQSGALVNLTA